MTEKQWGGIIAIEGKPTTDGRLILPGALVFPKTPVAVIAPEGWRLVGNAETFGREGEVIRAAGTVRVETTGLTPVIFLSSVELDKGRKDLAVFTKAEVRAVLLVDKDGAAWPECQFDD